MRSSHDTHNSLETNLLAIGRRMDHGSMDQIEVITVIAKTVSILRCHHTEVVRSYNILIRNIPESINVVHGSWLEILVRLLPVLSPLYIGWIQDGTIFFWNTLHIMVLVLIHGSSESNHFLESVVAYFFIVLYFLIYRSYLLEFFEILGFCLYSLIIFKNNNWYKAL